MHRIKVIFIFFLFFFNNNFNFFYIHQAKQKQQQQHLKENYYIVKWLMKFIQITSIKLLLKELVALNTTHHCLIL